ncbi:cytidylyltransferase domain-containing protein [Endothiovibrio diazotrophicus]
MAAGRTVAIVQARMGSTRRPRKMAEELAGLPLIHHVLARAQAIPGVDEVVLATTGAPDDRWLVRYAREMGVTPVCGSEENVLQRFIDAAERARAEYLIRLCGDAPLVDPGEIAREVQALREEDADLVLWPPESGPHAQQGAEAVALRTLLWSRERAADHPRAREHVVAYARDHWRELKTRFVAPDPRLAGRFKFSIDTQRDLEFMREIYRRLHRPGELVSLFDAVRLVREDEVLARENEALYRATYG